MRITRHDAAPKSTYPGFWVHALYAHLSAVAVAQMVGDGDRPGYDEPFAASGWYQRKEPGLSGAH